MGLIPKKSFVGLDLGHFRMKAVQIDRSPSGWKVTRSISAPTPCDTIKDGIVIDTAVLGLAIKNMLREGHIHATSASIAVSGGTVVVRPVRIPKMAEASLRKSIRFEASRYVPNSIEDSFIEFEIVGDADATNMDILVAAAPKEIVETRMKACEAAGLSVESVEIAAFASYRSIVQANQDHDWDAVTIAMIDIGSNLTNMSVIDKGTFSMTRSIPSGGQVFTEALKSYFKLSEADAEVGKTQLDVANLIDQGATMENPPLRVLHSHLDDLVREVRRSMNYWQSQQGEGPSLRQIDMLVLCGGGMKLQGLHRYFEHKLGIKCLSLGIYDNPRFVSSHPSEDRGLDLAVAAGLAMATATGEKKKASAKKSPKSEAAAEETEAKASKPGREPKPPKPPKPPKKSKKSGDVEGSIALPQEPIASEPEVLSPAAAFVQDVPVEVAGVPATPVAPPVPHAAVAELSQVAAAPSYETPPYAFAPPVEEIAERPEKTKKSWFKAPKAVSVASIETEIVSEAAPKKSLFARKAKANGEELIGLPKPAKKSWFGKNTVDETTLEGTFVSATELSHSKPAKQSFFGKKPKIDETEFEGTYVPVTAAAVDKPAKRSLFSKKPKLEAEPLGEFVEVAPEAVVTAPKRSLFGKRDKGLDTSEKVEKQPRAKKVKAEKAPKAAKPAFSLFAKKKVFIQVAPTEIPGTFVKVENTGAKRFSLFSKDKGPKVVVPKPIKPSKEVHDGFSFLKKRKGAVQEEVFAPSVSELSNAHAAAHSTGAEIAEINQDAAVLKELQQQEGILPGTTFPLLRKQTTEEIAPETVASIPAPVVAEAMAPVVDQAHHQEFQAPTAVSEAVPEAVTPPASDLATAESEQQMMKARPKVRSLSNATAFEETVAEAPSELKPDGEPKTEPAISAQGYMFIGGQMTYIASTSATSTNPERAA